jgi:hypothetical protein
MFRAKTVAAPEPARLLRGRLSGQFLCFHVGSGLLRPTADPAAQHRPRGPGARAGLPASPPHDACDPAHARRDARGRRPREARRSLQHLVERVFEVAAGHPLGSRHGLPLPQEARSGSDGTLGRERSRAPCRLENGLCIARGVPGLPPGAFWKPFHATGFRCPKKPGAEATGHWVASDPAPHAAWRTVSASHAESPGSRPGLFGNPFTPRASAAPRSPERKRRDTGSRAIPRPMPNETAVVTGLEACRYTADGRMASMRW